jgi:hypothetical protein
MEHVFFSTTKILIVIIAVLILAVYYQYYSKFNKGYEITQTYLDKVTINLLYEKSPIVIYDTLKNPTQLLKTLFKYSYAFKKEYTTEASKVYRSKSKHSIIYSSSEHSTLLNLINPKYKNNFTWNKGNNSNKSDTELKDTNVEYITIKLKQNQVVILPAHWIIQCESSLHKIDLDDPLSYIFLLPS